MLEKGGVWDKWNRFTQRIEKGVIVGGGAVWLVTGAPIAAWVTVEAAKWFALDWGSEKLINKGAEKIGLRKKDGVAHSSYSLNLNHGMQSSNMEAIEVKSNKIYEFPSQGQTQPAYSLETYSAPKYQPREMAIAA